ncbi:MAG: ATP-binding protein [Candidatus Promineifilaceae bacterium]
MIPACILILEDEQTVADAVRHMLEHLGYIVPDIATTGEAAINLITQCHPDLLLIDIHLIGEMDGIVAAQIVRDRFDIPIIFLTGDASQTTVNRARLTEPFGYLLKPPGVKDLQVAVEIALYKHESERRLREQEQWLSTILNSVGDAVIATDEQGQIVFINPAAESLTGWSHDEAAGQSLNTVFQLVDGETMKPISNQFSKIMTGRQIFSFGEDTLLIQRDGESRPIENTAAPIVSKQGKIIGVVLAFHDTTQRKLAEGELRLYQENLETLVEERTTALEELNNRLQQEISERKLAQEKMTFQTQQLAQSNAELEQFAYVASHDLREPLRKIESYTELLAKRYQGQLDERADKYIHYIVDGTQRMQQLINELLLYSRLGRYGPETSLTPISKLLSAVLSDLELIIEETDATIIVDPLPTLPVDASQISRLLQNLIGNALKFHGDSPPEIRISAHQRSDDWLFSVSDNGIGIDPKNAERIFLIFQRLHARNEYPGTGIGLAVCKKIVENHNGRIWVESRPGKGATFCFTLPLPVNTPASR